MTASQWPQGRPGVHLETSLGPNLGSDLAFDLPFPNLGHGNSRWWPLCRPWEPWLGLHLC